MDNAKVYRSKAFHCGIQHQQINITRQLIFQISFAATFCNLIKKFRLRRAVERLPL